MTTSSDPDESQEHRRSSEQPLPRTQAPRAGEPPAAGRVTPAEKSEPSGVPVEEQRHNADPNAPQTRVSPPDETQVTPEETGGVPASSLRQGPDDGTDAARRAAQIPSTPPPAAGKDSEAQRSDASEDEPAKE